MDYSHINFNKIPSYNKINLVFQKIEYINVLKRNYKNDSLILESFSQSVLNHIKKSEEKVFNCYKDETKEIIDVLPIVNSKKTKEIEPVFYQMSEDAKKEIFSYIYWKYKHEYSNDKVNLQNLKKIMALKGSKEEHIQPVEIEIKCPKCDGKGIIYFYNYELEDTTYKCINCGHKEKVGWHQNFYTLLNCYCNSCFGLKEELEVTIKNNLKMLFNDINSELLNNYFEIEDILPPSQLTMEKDFKLYIGNLSKDEREVLSFKPKCKEELLKIIDDIETRDSTYSKKSNNVIEKLREHRVIYYTRYKINNEEIKNKLYELTLERIVEIKEERYEIVDINKKIEYLNNLYNYLDEAPLDDFFKIYMGELRFKIDNIYIEYNKCFYPKLTNTHFFKKDLVINTNYINRGTRGASLKCNEHLVKKGLIRKLFRSNAETSAYSILRNRYSNSIIIPNYDFLKVFSLELLKLFLNYDEIKYLEKCILDFVLYDNEGIPFKVIELQKGDHHNESEWIRKDSIKKRACELMGVEFEELF